MKYKATAAGQRKLKSVFIHRPLQREFTMLMVIILMIATLLTGVVIHLTIQEIVTGNVGGMGATVGAYEFLSEINQKLLVRVFAVLFVTVLIAIWRGSFSYTESQDPFTVFGLPLDN